MDLKSLLEKLDYFAGQAVGQKSGDQVRGKEKAKPARKISGTPYSEHPFKGRLVGGGAEQQQENMLKDLSKGKTPKSKEQELAEEYKAFLEAEFRDTVEKRPARKNARPARGHAPQSRYKTIKADESYMSEKDIELQDYRSMTNQEFQTAYGVSKMEWINQNKALVIQNPDIKKSLGINESHYKWVISFKDGKQAIYHQKSPHYSDATAASDIEYTLKSNPGAEIELATKDDQAFDWQALLNEADDNNPVEARWIVKVEDDEGQHLKTFRDEFPNLTAAKKAYEKHKPYASDFKYTSVKKEQVEETLDPFSASGFNPLRDERDYLDKLSYLSNLARKQGMNKEMQDHIKQRILDLNREAKTKGFTQVESRAHKVISTKLKNLERERKFASGELNIPTPQERQAQLKKLETEPKQVKEYGANNPPQKTSPAQAQQVAANLNIQKTALNQLKQINPEIDPAKAAAAMTKDTATMSPQEKDELAQVAKTVGPALGTPAFGSIKTAIQKSQVK